MVNGRTIGGELAKALSVLAIVFLSFGHQNPPGLIGAQGPTYALSNCGNPAPNLPLGGDAHDHGCPVHHIGVGYSAALPPLMPVRLVRAGGIGIPPKATGLVPPGPLNWSSPPRAPPAA